jgi:hypothetical protein
LSTTPKSFVAGTKAIVGELSNDHAVSDLAVSPSKRRECVRKRASYHKTVLVFHLPAGLKSMLAGKVGASVRNVGERFGVFTSPVSIAQVLPLKFRRFS